MAYAVNNLNTSDIRTIRPEHYDDFFKALERVTGLDRAVTTTILESRKIQHPEFEVSKLPVEPQ